jgi:hypothetical protein
LRECTECGYVFDEKEILKFEASIPEFKSVKFGGIEYEEHADPVWYEVESSYMDIHTSRKTRKELGVFVLKYFVSEESSYTKKYKIFFCLPDQYDGYAVEKAMSLWGEFCQGDIYLGDVYFPESIKEWSDIMESYSRHAPCPEKILLDENGDYPQMIDYKFKNENEGEDEEVHRDQNIIEDDIPF